MTEDEILQWLSNYGEVTSKLEEDVFRDEEANDGVGEGTNRTGNYSVMMKLERPIPQLLPMCGRRVKIYHAGIQKLCTNCFGPHKKSQCTNVKVAWTTYVKNFIEENNEFAPEMYGKWIDILQKVRNEQPTERHHESEPDLSQEYRPQRTQPETNDPNTANQNTNPDGQVLTNQKPNEDKAPTEEEFDIPTTKEAYESMLDRFKTVGISKSEADEAIKIRTTAYNKACREHKKRMIEKRKQNNLKAGANTRRNSLNKQ